MTTPRFLIEIITTVKKGAANKGVTATDDQIKTYLQDFTLTALEMKSTAVDQTMHAVMQHIEKTALIDLSVTLILLSELTTLKTARSKKLTELYQKLNDEKINTIAADSEYNSLKESEKKEQTLKDTAMNLGNTCADHLNDLSAKRKELKEVSLITAHKQYRDSYSAAHQAIVTTYEALKKLENINQNISDAVSLKIQKKTLLPETLEETHRTLGSVDVAKVTPTPTPETTHPRPSLARQGATAPGSRSSTASTTLTLSSKTTISASSSSATTTPAPTLSSYSSPYKKNSEFQTDKEPSADQEATKKPMCRIL